jgi:hypothetical protein
MNADKNCALFIGVYPRSSAAQKTFGGAGAYFGRIVPRGGQD